MGYYITSTTIYNDKISRITTSTVAPTLVSAYIDDAESIINGFIAKQYNVDSVTTARPPILQSIAKDLTTYYIVRDGYTRDNQNISEWAERKREDVYDLLERISKDEIRLVSVEGSTLTPISPDVNINMKSSLSGRPLIMNVDTVTAWKVPDNLLSDISSDRML